MPAKPETVAQRNAHTGVGRGVIVCHAHPIPLNLEPEQESLRPPGITSVSAPAMGVTLKF